MTNQALVGLDEAQKTLSELGFDFDKELADISVESNGLDLPRVRISHSDSGRHKMYLDMGDNYLSDESPEIELKGNRLEAVVFAEQQIRAFWKDGEQVPACSGINGTPIPSEPVSESCSDCPEAVIGSGRCKPKARLMILAEVDGVTRPLIFNLSPTSLKHWNSHKKRLQRSNLPVVAAQTVFTLEDVKKNGYRWAEVRVSVAGIASTETLMIAKQARSELEKLTQHISDQDFSDPGDKLPS